MASGIPVISTRVGQATDLIRHRKNGWLVEVEDSTAIARWALGVRDMEPAILASLTLNGRATAEANSYPTADPLMEKIHGRFCCMRKIKPLIWRIVTKIIAGLPKQTRKRLIEEIVSVEKTSPPREAIEWLLGIHDYVGLQIDNASIRWGQGVHIKHELIG